MPMQPSPLRIVRIAVTLISLGLAVSAGRTIIELWQRRDVVSVRERELKKVQSENDALERKLKDMAGDAYVERVARDQLGMVKEGETIVMLPEGKADKEKNGLLQDLPNWKKWWQIFFGP